MWANSQENSSAGRLFSISSLYSVKFSEEDLSQSVGNQCSDTNTRFEFITFSAGQQRQLKPENKGPEDQNKLLELV